MMTPLNGSWSWLLVVLAGVMCGTVERAASYRDSRQQPAASLFRPDDEDHAWREFREFREWQRSKNDWKQQHPPATSRVEEEYSAERDQQHSRFIEEKRINSDGEGAADRRRGETWSELVDPPPIDEPALMGRYIVNQADWTSVATISSRKDIASFPFVNIVSFSDGPLGNGTGIPYMYITPLDFTAKDIALDHRATLMMTLGQGQYCKLKAMDPMDPRCARIHLTGKIKEVKPGTAELEVAKNAVFGRHPKLANMPEDHHFFFAKLKIASIAVLDTFGGPKYVTVQDYLHPPSPKDQNSYVRRKRLQSKDFNNGNNNNYPITPGKYVYRV